MNASTPEKAATPVLWGGRFGDEGEHCHDCGGTYDRMIWRATDELWMQLVGKESGLLCPPCFDDRAKAAGIELCWLAEVQENTDEPTSFADGIRAMADDSALDNTDSQVTP